MRTVRHTCGQIFGKVAPLMEESTYEDAKEDREEYKIFRYQAWKETLHLNSSSTARHERREN